MKKNMLDDLNVMLQTARDFKQEFFLYRKYTEKVVGVSYTERNFISNALMRMSFINLYQLISVSGYDYFSLWNFWGRIERGEYREAHVCPLTIGGWRQALLGWREQIEIVKNLRNKYASHLVIDTTADEQVIALKDVEDMFCFVEGAILEVLNPLVNGNFTHIGIVSDQAPGGAGAPSSTPAASATPVVNLTFHAA
ncbi:hypothetical protein DLD77_04420 [Chitinophaga alhagiae]|uniref:HEPN AbiU2-like domain-containing protein n=1 Tax=Chitinophaga alhagiae TaxID=2203219 RepID=A0ABM6WAJ8_9BACT|nr:hypothetical protein [Chitinophaga alhagiae]AWO00996.1 hypothetical protein DLD77_04420 [Chitinophaga alhagiae]